MVRGFVMAGEANLGGVAALHHVPGEGEVAVSRKRPKGVLGLGWACIDSAAHGRTEHFPTSNDYPESVMRRVTFTAGGGLGWKISALTTTRERPCPLKIVVVPGAPSWAEYWAPALAALPLDREMIVVDRPGFAASEPATCVPDIRLQAAALSPLLEPAPGQKILLVGQSYGAAIATVMAARNPKALAGVVLLSSFLGEPGPTARFLVNLGLRALNLIPRDLRNAILEVSGQAPQLAHMRQALRRLQRAGTCDPRRRGRLRADRAGRAAGGRAAQPATDDLHPGAGRQPLPERRPHRGDDERAGAVHPCPGAAEAGVQAADAATAQFRMAGPQAGRRAPAGRRGRGLIPPGRLERMMPPG